MRSRDGELDDVRCIGAVPHHDDPPVPQDGQIGRYVELPREVRPDPALCAAEGGAASQL